MGVLALSEGGSFEKKEHELYVPERSSKTRWGGDHQKITENFRSSV